MLHARFRSMLLVAAACLLAVRAVAAEGDFPLRPISLIVPAPENGPEDSVARILADNLRKTLNVEIRIENRDGFDGNLGAAYVAGAEPDGYKLLLGNAATHGVNPARYAKLPYDPVAGFAPISLLVEFPDVLLASPGLPAHSLPDLLALLRAHPGQYDYATAGTGSRSDLLGQMFKLVAGVDIVPTAYKGIGPGLADLMGNHVALAFASLPATSSFIRNHRLQGLAVTTPEGAASVPDVPSMAAAGLPGYDTTNWVGLFAPAGTSPERVARLNRAVLDALGDLDVQTKLLELEAILIGSPPAVLAEQVRSELAKWGPVVNAAGARIE